MMPLSEIFFLAIVLYLLYRFIFNFLVPVARTTRQVRQQFRNMQDAADVFNRQQTGQQQTDSYQRTSSSHEKDGSTPKAPPGDYIDFEEIKD